MVRDTRTGVILFIEVIAYKYSCSAYGASVGWAGFGAGAGRDADVDAAGAHRRRFPPLGRHRADGGAEPATLRLDHRRAPGRCRKRGGPAPVACASG
jgi:hypothetical protein